MPEPLAPIAITVDEHFAMAPGGALRMVFESDAGDSTMYFAPGTPGALGGTLELTFADDVNLAIQFGRTPDLFDWTGGNCWHRGRSTSNLARLRTQKLLLFPTN
jgi:hypothetical protein